MPSTTRHRRERDRDRRVFTPRRVRRIEGATLLLVATVGVILATLRPTAPTAAQICIICGPYAGVDAVLNVLLFVPVGAGLALLGVQWRTALGIGVAATIVIETLQFALPLGRVASMADLVTNTTGTAIGFYLSEHRRSLAYPRSRGALRHASFITAAWLFSLIATAVALLPSVPDGPYLAEWSPTVVNLDRYAGRIVDANVSGVRTPNGRLPSENLNEPLRREVTVEVTVEPRTPPLGLAPVIRLLGADSVEVLLLAQRRNDLLFRSRVVGARLRLATPTVVMHDAVALLEPADRGTVIVSGRRDGGRLRVGAVGNEAVLDLHAGAGWLLFVPPASALQDWADLLSAAWVGMPLFAAAYWAGRRARRRARRAGDAMRMRGAGGQILLALVVLVGVATVGMSGISALFGMAQPSWDVWMGAITGIGFGLAVGASLALAHDDRGHGTHRDPTASGSAAREAQTASV